MGWKLVKPEGIMGKMHKGLPFGNQVEVQLKILILIYVHLFTMLCTISQLPCFIITKMMGEPEMKNALMEVYRETD